MVEFNFKCPCCEEVIFSNYHTFDKHGIKLEGSILTYGNTKLHLRPTQAYIIAILAEAYPHPIYTPDLRIALGSINLPSRWNNRNDDAVSNNNLTTQVCNLRKQLRSTNIRITLRQYHYYALSFEDERSAT